ncbi:MAG: iron chelate uptake ABC transporter family permease subunit [Propionibacteriaceae bacterium]|nr:iron chelate uptake ABC transporter family permease subunit [Propionibacteriaceae bacterium]
MADVTLAPPRVSAARLDPASAHPDAPAGLPAGRSGRATPPRTARASGPLPTASGRRRYTLVVAGLIGLAVLITIGSLAWANPMPVGSPGFWLIAEMRATNLAVIAVVACAQAFATVAFQTVTGNRILTPSIMGFESLYRVVQTAAVFVLGGTGVAAVTGLVPFLAQVALMVAFATLLYGWLFSGRNSSLHVTLLVGIILGAGLGAIATFMQRLLTPSEFDVLTARLIGSIATAQTSYLWVAVPIVAVVCAVLWLRSGTLNVLGLGRAAAVNLGVDHRRQTLIVLVLTAVLMAVSTALVGPMTFLGFLVAMLAYQLSDTYCHRRIFPVAALVGFVVLAGAHLLLKHVFYAEGSVGIIIELVGGSFFLIHLLRKGRL